MRYIGMMSGTSMDAVDAVLVDFEQRQTRLIAYEQTPMPRDLRDELRGVTPAAPLAQVAQLDGRVGMLFADAALRLLAAAGVKASDVAAIGSHGQTVFHSPGSAPPVTVQIGDPNLIAELTGITTVADLRRMDMAAGGQGAPLAPAIHDWLFRKPGGNRAVVNIGGIANVSVLPAITSAAVTGFDTGPGNGLMDRWIGRHRQQPMDRNGEWARQGQVIEALLEALLKDPYFGAAPPKSTGPEYFNLQWLEAALKPGWEAVDVQATLLQLTATSIAHAITLHAPGTADVLLCGGGVENGELTAALQQGLSPIRVRSTAEEGVDPHAMEALLCAWLAMRRLEGQAGNLPAVTGARHPVLLGAIYQPASRVKL